MSDWTLPDLILFVVAVILVARLSFAWGLMAGFDKATDASVPLHDKELRLRRWHGGDAILHDVWEHFTEPSMSVRRGPYDWHHDEGSGL